MATWRSGHVQWFDKSSGEGVVIDKDGRSYHVHYSAIVPNRLRSKTTKVAARRNLEDGAAVEFKVYENLYSARVSQIREEN